MMKILVNKDIWILRFSGYFGNIGGYFDKNTSEIKIYKKYFKKLEKIIK